ncbi:hypothetical protein niasHT_008056 [Heterodera trifolii]|uniref:Uncharacterized protein n=1 Tax=Heterodera trifolii TaxID=157864 RepID=A0ABD2LZX4_9BILA
MIKSARGKGLRRVNPTTLLYSTQSDGNERWEEVAIWEGIGDENENANGGEMLLTPIFAMPPNQSDGAAQIDEHLHQLVRICTTVHRQAHAVTQKLGRAVDAVNATDGESPRKACELLRIYERIIWRSIIEIDLNIKTLSSSVRESIDSCKINEPRLEWLLSISKFRVEMENAIGSEIGICKEIERILRIRARGEVRGLRIKGETVAKVKAIANEIANKTMKIIEK